MHELAPLIYDLAIMLGVAGFVVLLFQRIHQPVVLGYLVAGVIIGPYTTEYTFMKDIPNIQILSELGVIFLMFSLGLEFSFQKLTKVGFSALITGLIDVSFMMAIGYGTAAWLGWSQMDRIFLGASLAISSTTIIFKAVGEMGLRTKRFSEVIFGVLIVEDLLAILILVGLSTLVTSNNVSSLELLFSVFKLVVVVGGWFIVGYFLVPTLFRRLSGYISQETLTIVSVGLCLFLVCVAAYFHYSTALGAFIMGSILAETDLVHRIEENIVPIRDIFGAIFFISVGMLINPSVIVNQWQYILLITIVLMLGKVFIVTFATFLTGQSLKTAMRAGFGMAQIGEFSFIIASLGVSLNVLDDKLYPIIVAISCITTFTTPYMFRLSGFISEKVEQNLPDRVKYFFNQYSAWVYRVQTSRSQESMLGSVTMRVIINGIIVVIIFTISKQYFYGKIHEIFQRAQTARMLSELLAILLSSPFIWGMLFSYRLANIPEYTKKTLNPIMFLVWMITLIELIFLSIVYFHTWVTTAIFIFIVTVFFAVAYRHLERSYHWFEDQLIKNIKKKPDSQQRVKELSPWDTHLVEMIVGDASPFIGKTLGEIELRETYGVSIVAIRHGHQTMIAPRGKAIINDNDKLFVLGNDEQIDSVREQIIRSSNEVKHIDHLSDFALKPLLVSASNAIVGKSIRDSFIREQLNALVAGVERGDKRILNPSPDFVIHADDILLLVGEEQAMKDYFANLG